MSSDEEVVEIEDEDEVDESKKAEILKSIEAAVARAIDSMMTGEPLSLSVKYRILNATSRDKQVNFLHKRSSRRFSLYIKLMSIIQNLLNNDLYATTRDLYYQYKELFETQINLISMVDDIASTFNVPRSSLHILSSNKGLVAGNLEIVDLNGNLINCQNTRTGILIPHCVDKIKSIKSTAEFVLIVEKDATFQRLLDDEFLKQYNCILLTGKGMPDISTRLLANLIWRRFDLPSYCLVDANPYGIQIMIIYKHGSASISHDKENLKLPNLQFIGLNIKDLEKVPLKRESTAKLSEFDQRKAASLLNKELIEQEAELKEQLEHMLAKNIKAEIQCLQTISTKFLSEVYLKMKLKSHERNERHHGNERQHAQNNI